MSMKWNKRTREWEDEGVQKSLSDFKRKKKEEDRNV
jgi:hypothetical protein